MEQIIVRHPDGTTALLTSRARKSGVTKAEQSITLLGAVSYTHLTLPTN